MPISGGPYEREENYVELRGSGPVRRNEASTVLPGNKVESSLVSPRNVPPLYVPRSPQFCCPSKSSLGFQKHTAADSGSLNGSTFQNHRDRSRILANSTLSLAYLVHGK